MADEKEAFVRRWSRLKHEQNEKPAVPEKAAETPKPDLPPVEKLTPDSDFSQFMHPKVEDTLRRVALKKLFSDPHFSLPDPYEAYSGDWTVGEPISEEMLATLNQAQQLLFGEKKEEQKKEEGKPEVTEAPAEVKKTESDEPGRKDA